MKDKGRAAKRARRKLRRYFKNLAERDSVKFGEEWEKRVSSWLNLINKYEECYRDHNDKRVPPVFSIVDEALDLLWNCGPEIYKEYAVTTSDLLSGQCCKNISKIEPVLFRNSNIKHIVEITMRGERHSSMCGESRQVVKMGGRS